MFFVISQSCSFWGNANNREVTWILSELRLFNYLFLCIKSVKAPMRLCSLFIPLCFFFLYFLILLPLIFSSVSFSLFPSSFICSFFPSLFILLFSSISFPFFSVFIFPFPVLHQLSGPPVSHFIINMTARVPEATNTQHKGNTKLLPWFIRLGQELYNAARSNLLKRIYLHTYL